MGLYLLSKGSEERAPCFVSGVLNGVMMEFIGISN